MPARYRTTKAGHTWGRTISGWVLTSTSERGRWFARRRNRLTGGPQGLPGVRYETGPWVITLYNDTDGLWTFEATTLDAAVERILTHPLAPRAVPVADPQEA